MPREASRHPPSGALRGLSAPLCEDGTRSGLVAFSLGPAPCPPAKLGCALVTAPSEFVSALSPTRLQMGTLWRGF